MRAGRGWVRRTSGAAMAGEDGCDLLVGRKAGGVGVGEAAVDAGEFGCGGVVGCGGKAGFDFLGVCGQFRPRFGGPSGCAGEGVGEGASRHGEMIARWELGCRGHAVVRGIGLDGWPLREEGAIPTGIAPYDCCEWHADESLSARLVAIQFSQTQKHDGRMTMAKPSLYEIENAFQPASEISDTDRFAGRAKPVSDAFLAMMAEGANIAIVGNRGIGKTSLAR